jgi:tetratricopeptide (TPR) repeat protein
MPAPSTTPATCATCGRPLVDGVCSSCDVRPVFALLQREILVLVLLSATVVAGFLLTRRAAAANRQLRLQDAATWFQEGQIEFAQHRNDAAIRSLRRAAAIDRDNRQYQLALARALAAGHEDEAARQVLLGVRALTPEDSQVNLELARLETRNGDLTSALRFYQNALYGNWNLDRQDARREVRVELIRYLLTHDQRSRALSELLILSSNIPDEVSAHVETGDLFLKAGDNARALEHFRRALQLDATSEEALEGAGDAAFSLGEYASARQYLHDASSTTGRTADLRQMVDLVLAYDPLASGLSTRERQSRVQRALGVARDRLNRCLARAPGYDTPQDLPALRDRVDAFGSLHDAVRGSTEATEEGLRLTYQIEEVVPEACADLTPADRALRLIGRRREINLP